MVKIESLRTGGENHLVHLKPMTLAVPKDETQKLQLIEDLTRMGYEELLA